MFNIGAACASAQVMCGAKSKGSCAKYVRMMLEAGGLSTAGRPVSACNYKFYLPTIGFAHIGTITGVANQASWTSANAKPGDLAVMDHGVHGHICMWTGSRWCSDFIQNKMWPYAGDGTCYMFRYTGEISSAPFSMSDLGITGAMGDGISISYRIQECPEEIKFKYLYSLYRDMSGTATYAGGGFTSVNLGSLTNMEIGDAGVSKFMIAKLCQWECGKTFGHPMTQKELNGVDVGDADGHKTYGYGSLMYDDKHYMDQVKKVWTQPELEAQFLNDVNKRANKVKAWANSHSIQLNQNQIDAIVSGCYNFGMGFLKKNICSMIARNPQDPQIPSTWAHLSDAQGRKYPGLITRRQEEARWYAG